MIPHLFLIILIALLIIICIILYNGIRIHLTVEKIKSIARYEFKITMLKITVFKRSNDEEDDSADHDESDEDESEDDDEDIDDDDESIKSKINGLKKKYEEIKPILSQLKKSKDELKKYLRNILKTIDFKRLEGDLTIGLNNSATTIKIASIIWSAGAIINDSSKQRALTVNPRFTEEVIDFEGKMELKINLLLVLIYTLILLTKRNILILIKEVYNYYRLDDEEDENKESDIEENTDKEIKNIEEKDTEETSNIENNK